jgi:hypothetical protein
MATTQEQMYEVLMERVRTDHYASGNLLDRIEALLYTPEQVIAYTDMLVEKVDADWYPSNDLMNRVQRMLTQVERARQAEQVRQQMLEHREEDES